MTTSGRYLTIGEQQVLNPAWQYEAAQRLGTPLDFHRRANSYTCPLGQEPGSAWLLMNRLSFEYLDVNAWHELHWRSEDDELIIPKLVMVRATCMSQDGDSKAAYLVEFRDKRHVLKMSAVNARYNLRLPLHEVVGANVFYPETMDEDESDEKIAWTWQRILEDLWFYLPEDLRGDAPELPYTPTGTPEEYGYTGSAWDAIGDYLASIGCEIRYDPIEDELTVIRLGTTQAGLAASATEFADRLMYDYKPKQNLNLATVPETIRVLFQRQADPKRDRWEIALPHEEDVATGASGAEEGTVVVLHDDLIARTDADGTVSNTSELSARANEVAQDYYNKLDKSWERLRRHYSGLITTILPGSEVREVVWRDYGNANLVTEFRNHPTDHKREVRARMRPVMRLRGIAVDSISHGTDGTVNLVKRTDTGYAYMRDKDDAHISVEAGFYSGNTGETIEPETAVYVDQFADGYYEVTGGNCTVRDWELEDEDE